MKKLSTILVCTILISLTSQAQKIEYTPDSLLKTHAFKMEFLSPLTGNLTLGYERYLKNFTSIEAKLGFIGVGSQQAYESTGVFVKIGPKFKLKPSYATEGTFGTHLLRGAYIKPELALSFFKRTEDNEYFYLTSDQSENISSGAILLNFGIQHVLGTIMTVDYYVGLGYGFSNVNDEGVYAHGYAITGDNIPLALAAGLTVGFLLK